MFSNRCLIFCKLFADYNTSVNLYYRDLAASICKYMADYAKCQLYCPYPEFDLKQQLSQVSRIRLLDPLLQGQNDYAFLLNGENSTAALHLFFTKTVYCDSFASSSQSLKYYLQRQDKKLKINEQVDAASPLSLAQKIGGKLVICLDANMLGQQTIKELDSILANKDTANLLFAFAIFNGQIEQVEAWQTLFKQRYNKEVCWHNQRLIAADFLQSNLRKMRKYQELMQADILQLSSKIYKRLLSLGLEKQRLKVALAYDQAFSAYDSYELQFLSQLGIDWYKFSPLHDKILPSDCLAYFFAAHELNSYLGALSFNHVLREQLRKACENGALFIAQDQAHLYLIDGAVDAKGTYYPELGLISQKARILQKNAKYAYAVVSAYQSNCFAPLTLPNVAFLNKSVELYPNLSTMRCAITTTVDQQQRQVNSGFCNKQIFSSLNRFWPATNYDWLEHFYLTLIQRLAKQNGI